MEIGRPFISEPEHALKNSIRSPSGLRTEAAVTGACSGTEKRFPGGRHRRVADSQTVIGAFDARRVTKWLIRKGQPGNKAFPIFVAVQCGPVFETGTLRFQIVLAALAPMFLAARAGWPVTS